MLLQNNHYILIEKQKQKQKKTQYIRLETAKKLKTADSGL